MEATAAAVAAQTSPAPASRNDHLPWERQQFDTELWYLRFLCYVALGPTRSVSLVSMGRRNAYPVPAHWPIQAKQLNWRERAEAFDHAAAKDPDLIKEFNKLLRSSTAAIKKAMRRDQTIFTEAVIKAGYLAPPPEEYEETGPPSPTPKPEPKPEPPLIFPTRPLGSGASNNGHANGG